MKLPPPSTQSDDLNSVLIHAQVILSWKRYMNYWSLVIAIISQSFAAVVLTN